MKVAIFTGPSGGHFYPALAFAEAFKRKQPEAELLLVTGERGRFLAEKAARRFEGQFRFEFLPDFPFPRPRQPDFLLRLLPFLLKLAQAFRKSGQILSSFEPDLSVGFGSYVTFPPLWVSRRKKIPALIHEQNRRSGEANRWAASLAQRIAVSFEGTEGLGSRPVVVTGLPLRASLVDGARGRNQAERAAGADRRLQILLLGGSQGSQALNRLWSEALDSFSGEEKERIAVIHITGEKDFEAVRAMYLAKGMEAQVFPFYEKMEELYSGADLAITRAGAGTLFELALFGLPAVVLPYPHAGAHQENNARYFEREGGVILVREEETRPGEFKNRILELIQSSSLRSRLSENLKRLAKPEAAEKLVEMAEALLGEREVCLR